MATAIDRLLIQGTLPALTSRDQLASLLGESSGGGVRSDNAMHLYTTYTPVVRRYEHLARTRAARDGMSTMDAPDLPASPRLTSTPKAFFIVQGKRVEPNAVRPATETTMSRRRAPAMRLAKSWDAMSGSRSCGEPGTAPPSVVVERSCRSLQGSRNDVSAPARSLHLPALTIGPCELTPDSPRQEEDHRASVTSIDAYIADSANDELDLIKVRLKRKKLATRDRQRDNPRQAVPADLRSCLQVRPSSKLASENAVTELKLKHQTQFMQSKSLNGSQENLSPRSARKPTPTKPRYKFRSLNSYLNYNQRQMARVGGELVFLNSTNVRTPSAMQGTSDARLLRLMFEMNRPQSRVSTALYSDINAQKDLEDFFQVRPPRLDNKSRKSCRTDSRGPHDVLSEEQEDWAGRETWPIVIPTWPPGHRVTVGTGALPASGWQHIFTVTWNYVTAVTSVW